MSMYTFRKKIFLLGFISCTMLILWVLSKVLIFASFRIPSRSMEPTLTINDYILVVKPLIGARIFNIFNVFKGKHVNIWRLPGLNQIQVGDVLVFHNPYPNNNKRMEMHMLKYNIKRCIGLPKDTIYAKNKLTNGPFYIPAKGDSIIIDSLNYILYKEIIEWETQSQLTFTGKGYLLNEKSIQNYCFRKNYYFMVGDNKDDSVDSRDWGVIPEEFIVGKAWLIWKSFNPFNGQFRKERFLRLIR